MSNFELSENNAKKRGAYFTQSKKEIYQKKRRLAKWLLIPPILISLVSVTHLFEMFRMGNSLFLSIALAIGFEAITLVEMVVAKEFARLGKAISFLSGCIIVILVVLLATGNVFACFKYISNESVSIVSHFTTLPDSVITKRIIAIFIGAPISLLALSFLPIYIKYTQKDEDIIA